MARRGRSRPAGQLGEGDRDRIVEVVGEPAEPGAEDDPDLGHEIGPGTDGGHQGVEPGGLLGRAGWVDRGRSSRWLTWGSPERSIGGGPRPAGFDGPTEVSTPGCRSRPVGHDPRCQPW